mmetsp:Transcript_112752/g.291417  ORF Transcript_112752/g.291417 Transcript_112752/m.291417 type:complete len:249 (-) Transcript_112752:960-1706(-)
MPKQLRFQLQQRNDDILPPHGAPRQRPPGGPPQRAEQHRGPAAAPAVVLGLHGRDCCFDWAVVTYRAVARLPVRHHGPSACRITAPLEGADDGGAGTTCVRYRVLRQQVPRVDRVEKPHARRDKFRQVPTVVRAEGEEAFRDCLGQLRELDIDRMPPTSPGHHVAGVQDASVVPATDTPRQRRTAATASVDALRAAVVDDVEEAILGVDQAGAVEVVRAPGLREGPGEVEQHSFQRTSFGLDDNLPAG